jgi:hypothetical protein
MLVLFAGVSLSVPYISSADDGPAPPVNAAIPCYQLTGGTEGCGSIDGVVSCPAAPAAGAAMGSVCDVDATTMVVDIKTKIQLNFDDPCNL